MTAGHTVYYGSTTAGEMRELCDTRTFYADYVLQIRLFLPARSAAPARLHQLAVHAFSGGMFERQSWYPKLGFNKVMFGEQLVKQTNRVCGSAFRGACDADLAPVIAGRSRRTAPCPASRASSIGLRSTPIFRSRPAKRLTNFHCDREHIRFGRPTVCRMAELWHDFFNAS